MKPMSYALVLLVLVALRLAGGSLTVARANEAGGLPALTAQVQALTAQVQALQATVATLQTANTTLETTVASLQATVASLQAANTTVQHDLTTLQTALAQETSQRSTAVASLQTALTTEGANRLGGDQHLLDLLTPFQTSGLPELFMGQQRTGYITNNNTGKVIAILAVPAGQYMLQALVPISGEDSDVQFGGCILTTIPPGVPEGADYSFPPLAWQDSRGDQAALLLAGYSNEENGGSFQRITLINTATLHDASTVAVLCHGYLWGVLGTRIIALKVGNLP